MQGFQLYLLLSWFLASWTSSASILSDGESLQVIRDAWKLNQSWWQGDNPCNGWEGVQCDVNNRVKYLNLSNRGIYGPMPDAIGNLNHLINLDLSNIRNSSGPFNRISGNLSPLRSLTNLLHLNLTFNSIQLNTFPAVIYKLSNLITLKLDNNHISGSLPTELSQLKNLVYLLDSTGNCFTGYNRDSNIKCHQQHYYDCDSFFQEVPNGSCPACPPQQSLQDPVTCVCMINISAGGTISHKKATLIGSIVGVVALTMFFLFLFWRWFGIPKRSKKDEWEGPEGVQRFHYHDLFRATNGFSSSHEIGIGGFGKVFCGTVDGKTVAIKRAHAVLIKRSSGFRNEVILLSRLHHRNLVHLLGFCEEDGIQILVYEYMPNGNLQTLLFKNQTTIQLDWLKRLDIAIGVAQGLDYLHSFADPPVIHRDVKPSNVLLDENLVAKLSDFGISREAPEFQTQYSTMPAGTVGYIDPQYILREQLTTASDVYSFGMVLLELISGQKSIDNTRLVEKNLVEWAKIKLRTESLRSIVDPRLGDDYPEKVYHDIVRLAIDCASFDTESRPSMKVVVSILDACRWSVAPHLHEPMDNMHESAMPGEESHFTREKKLVRDDDNSFVDGSSYSFTASIPSPR